MEEPKGVAGSGADDESVAVTTAALGNWAELWSGSTAFFSLNVGRSFFAADLSFGACSEIQVRDVATGASLNAPQLPVCERVLRFQSDDAGVFATTSSNRVYTLPIVNGVPGTWLLLDQLWQYPLGAELWSDSAYVYFRANGHIYAVARGGGPRITVASGATQRLLGVDDGYVYTRESAAGGGYNVYKISTSGWSQVFLLHVDEMPDPDGPFRPSFDACCMYYAESTSGGTNRIRRLTKDGLSLTNIKSSTAEAFSWPVSNGSALYFVERNLTTIVDRFRRKNLSNGNYVSVVMPYGHGFGPVGVSVRSNGVSVAGRTTTVYLYRGSL